MNTITRFALRVVVLAVIVYVVTRLYSGVIVVANPDAVLGKAGTYVWVALVFAVVNSVLGPVLRLLSLPFVVLTLGLFLLVVNAILLAVAAGLSDRLDVAGFSGAVVGGFLIALFSWAAELVLPLRKA